MSASDFLRRDEHPASATVAVPARPAQYHAKLSGIATTPQQLSDAYGAVMANHDAIINVTYLVPDESRFNAKLLLSIDSKLATWRNILDLLRNHFAIYHGTVVPDSCIMIILGKNIMAHRRNDSHLFFSDIMNARYPSSNSDDDEQSLQLFVAVVGRGYTHAIDGTPMRGLAIIYGSEKTIVTCLITATVAHLGEDVRDVGVELFSPSSSAYNTDADRLAIMDLPYNIMFDTADGRTISGAPLETRVLNEYSDTIPRFSISRHIVSAARHDYYDNSAAFESSPEDDEMSDVLHKREERDYALRLLENATFETRLIAEHVLVEESEDEDSDSTVDPGRFDDGSSEASLPPFDLNNLDSLDY